MNRINDVIIQLCKFGAVGGLCFGIDYGLMIFLTETHIMHYFASSAVSFTVSVIVNYILSMRFVFTGKEDMTLFRSHDEGTGDGYFCGTQYDRACDEPDDHVVCRRTFRNVLCSSKNILHHVSYYV